MMMMSSIAPAALVFRRGAALECAIAASDGERESAMGFISNRDFQQRKEKNERALTGRQTVRAGSAIRGHGAIVYVCRSKPVDAQIASW